MLPRKNRLSRFFRSQSNVFDSGIKIFFKNNSLPDSRFGVSIKTGVLKKAVWRNRAKRLIREFLKNNLSRLKAGFDVFILVQSGDPSALLEADFWDKILTGLFKKSGIYG